MQSLKSTQLVRTATRVRGSSSGTAAFRIWGVRESVRAKSERHGSDEGYCGEASRVVVQDIGEMVGNQLTGRTPLKFRSSLARLPMRVPSSFRLKFWCVLYLEATSVHSLPLPYSPRPPLFLSPPNVPPLPWFIQTFLTDACSTPSGLASKVPWNVKVCLPDTKYRRFRNRRPHAKQIQTCLYSPSFPSYLTGFPLSRSLKGTSPIPLFTDPKTALRLFPRIPGQSIAVA